MISLPSSSVDDRALFMLIYMSYQATLPKKASKIYIFTLRYSVTVYWLSANGSPGENNFLIRLLVERNWHSPKCDVVMI